MKGLIAGVAALMLVSAGASHAKDADYRDLLAKAKAGEAVDWQALRFAYAATADADGPPDEIQRKMFAALNAGEFDEALTQAKAILDKDYVDGEAHLVASIAYRHAKKDAEADAERALAAAIFKSIQTGDGLTAASAFTVISVGEEYELMRVLGRRVTQQALQRAGRHSYDVLTTTTEGGDQKDFYFQIDRVLEAEQKLFGGKK